MFRQPAGDAARGSRADLPAPGVDRARDDRRPAAIDADLRADRPPPPAASQVARPGGAGEAHPELHARLQADHDVEHLLPGAQRSRTPRSSPSRSPRSPSAASAPPTAPSDELDTIVWATGFRVFDHPGFAALRGRDGQDPLRTPGRAARAPTSAPPSPASRTSSCSSGPNSAGGYNSIIFSSEAHINYVAGCVREMERSGVATVEVRPEVYEAFDRETERRLGASVWNRGGCASWYLDPNGRNGDLVAGLHGRPLASHAPLRPQQLHRRAVGRLDGSAHRDLTAAGARIPGVSTAIAIAVAGLLLGYPSPPAPIATLSPGSSGGTRSPSAPRAPEASSAGSGSRPRDIASSPGTRSCTANRIATGAAGAPTTWSGRRSASCASSPAGTRTRPGSAWAT